MKKIQTPISRSIGNHEIRTPNSDGTFSSTGAAVMRTFFSVSRLTKLGSFGAYVVNGARPSLKWPLILLPWIVTSVTRPLFTSLRKSEKARVDCGPRLEEVWNKLKSATRSSPITIHRARFLPKLFTVKAFPCRAEHHTPRVNPTRQGLARDHFHPAKT